MLSARVAQPARTAHAVDAIISLFIWLYPLPLRGRSFSAVEQIAKELLDRLQVLRASDWRQNQTRAGVHSEITFKLNELPEQTWQLAATKPRHPAQRLPSDGHEPNTKRLGIAWSVEWIGAAGDAPTRTAGGKMWAALHALDNGEDPKVAGDYAEEDYPF